MAWVVPISDGASPCDESGTTGILPVGALWLRASLATLSTQGVFRTLAILLC